MEQGGTHLLPVAKWLDSLFLFDRLSGLFEREGGTDLSFRKYCLFILVITARRNNTCSREGGMVHGQFLKDRHN